MTDPPIENYDALDAGAQIGDRGAKGVITVLTERGLVAISMKRPVMEQLRHSIERELNENPIRPDDLELDDLLRRLHLFGQVPSREYIAAVFSGQSVTQTRNRSER